MPHATDKLSRSFEASDKFQVGGVQIVSRRDEFIVTQTIADITPQAAKVTTEVARLTHAVPAIEETKREYGKCALLALCVVGGLVELHLRPDQGSAVVGIVGVVGGTVAIKMIIKVFTKRKQS
jgi:hypothetical protein